MAPMQFAALWAALSLVKAAGLGHRRAAGWLRGAGAGAAAPGELSFGSPSCQCIGVQGAAGTTQLTIDNKTVAEYPAEVGSYCKAWDDGTDPVNCQDGQEPGRGNGWCAQPWCYVDACRCEGLPVPPKTTKRLPQVMFQGMPLYYSYSTCGGEDGWTKANNEMECTSAETAEACGKVGSGKECTWGDTPWGPKCLGWEAAGMCTGLPKESPWGKNDCPCVGFIGVNGTIRAQTARGAVTYPGGLGSVCEAWDVLHGGSSCTGDRPAEGCDQRWCFVDPDHCNLDEKPMKSNYLPDATWQGHALHYSYATCGGKAPLNGHHGHEPTSAAAAPATSEAGAPAAAQQPARAVGSSDRYDREAYDAEWHDEWRHGHVPAFRDAHPGARAYEDRQSDGRPSPVEERQ